MGTEKKQSAIQEVRDQLSLDFADGKYLNVVGANLGLTRPRVGFTDDAWRAVVKAIGLHYKQIRTKFEEVLAIFFGPRITVDSSLTQDAVAGQKSIRMAAHSDWPQLGTVIIDEGLATEETLPYCYIDRFTQEMFLSNPLAFNHTAAVKDAEQVLIGVDTVLSDRVIVSDISAFPDPGVVGEYTIVLGAGTDAEETAVVTAIDYVNRVLTLDVPLTNTHTVAFPSSIRDTLARAINPPHPSTGVIQRQGVALMTLNDVHQFPEAGNVLLTAAGPGRSGQAPREDLFLADSAGTTTTIDMAVGSFEAGFHSGSRVVFSSTTPTVALRGVEATILSNTGIQIVLAETLPAATANLEQFKIRANVRYTSVDYSLNTITLSIHIPDVMIESDGALINDTVDAGPSTSVIPLVTGGYTVNQFRGLRVLIGVESTMVVSNTASSLTVLPSLTAVPAVGAAVQVLFDTAVELLEPLTKWNGTAETVDMAQIKSQGTGWDIIQSNPKCIEILTPAATKDLSDLRSASYLHINRIDPTPVTTLSASTLSADESFIVVDPLAFPVFGVVTVDTELVAYRNLQTNLLADVAAGATTLFVTDASQFPAAGDIILDPGGPKEETVTISARDLVLNTLTVSATSDAHNAGTQIRDLVFHIPELAFTGAHLSGVAIELYQPYYIPPVVGQSEILDGNLWTIPDVFPGPYVYKPDELTWGGFSLQVFRTAPNFGVAVTEETTLLPGPVRMAITQVPGYTAIELEDATAMAVAGEVGQSLPLPFNLQTGLSTGNLETLQIFDVNLRQRATTTVQNASVAGATTLEVVETQGVGVGDSIPTATGYRLLIDRGTAEEEVVYVKSIAPQTNPTPDLITVENQMTHPHDPGSTVELMADILTTSIVSKPHEGQVDYVQRSTTLNATASTPSIGSARRISAEIVVPELENILIDDPTNFPASGGKVYLNFSRKINKTLDTRVRTIESLSTLASSPGQNFIEVADPSIYPVSVSPLTPFVVIFDPGGVKEERLLIEGAAGNNLLLQGSVLRFAHTIGTRVVHEVSTEELLTYDEVVGNNLRFSPPIVLQFTHSPGESAIVSLVDSVPSLDGYDFPFYLPPDLSFRLQSILDLVRAAGVAVKFIDKR